MLKKFLIGAFFVAAFALVASSASADCSITTTLKVGSKGAEVSCLQTKVGATSDGSFGPMTKASVMAYQASHGLSADGVVGPMSRAVLNAGGAVSGSFSAGCTSASGFSTTTGLSCISLNANTFAPSGCTSASGFSPVTGGACYATSSTIAGCTAGALFSSTTGASCTTGVVTTTTGPLVGGAGDISITSNLADVENQVIADTTNTKVLSFKVQADGSDVSINNLKVSLRNQNAPTGSSYRLDKYVSEVSVWMGGTKVGSALATDFTKDGYVYSKSIPLSGAIVRNGISGKQTFYVTVSSLSTIDSADYDTANWDILVDNVRFQDGTGVVMTSSDTAKVPASLTSSNIIAGVTGGFEFTTLAASGDATVVVSKGSGSPTVQNVPVSITSTTKDLMLLEFKVKTTGSTASFDTLNITTALTTAGNANVWSDIVSSLVLKDGSGTEISSIDAADIVTGTNIFTLYDTKTVAKDSTETFHVYANILKGVTDNFGTGTILTASLPASAFSPEDSSGGTISSYSGTATGSAQTLVYSVPTISLISTPTLVLYTAAHDSTPAAYKATFVFNVTAPDSGATYVPLDTFAYTTTGTSGILYTVTGGAVVTSGTMQYTGTDSVSSITETQSYRVDAGSSQQFTLNVYLTGNNASNKVAMTGLWYETTNTTPNNSPLISGLTNMYTPSTYLPSGL